MTDTNPECLGMPGIADVVAEVDPVRGYLVPRGADDELVDVEELAADDGIGEDVLQRFFPILYLKERLLDPPFAFRLP